MRHRSGSAKSNSDTVGIPRCIAYYRAINKCLADRNSPYKTTIAFFGRIPGTERGSTAYLHGLKRVPGRKNTDEIKPSLRVEAVAGYRYFTFPLFGGRMAEVSKFHTAAKRRVGKPNRGNGVKSPASGSL